MHEDKYKLKYAFLHCDAYAPSYATPLSEGFDLRCYEDFELAPGETKDIPTGLAMRFPDGYYMHLASKSSLSANNSIFVLNAPGIYDGDYRGEIFVCLHNASRKYGIIEIISNVLNFIFFPAYVHGFSSLKEAVVRPPKKFKSGMKIAQGVIMKSTLSEYTLKRVEKINEDTIRGTGGRGSSGEY